MSEYAATDNIAKLAPRKNKNAEALEIRAARRAVIRTESKKIFKFS